MSKTFVLLKNAQLQLSQIKTYINLNSNYSKGNDFLKELKKELIKLETFPLIGKQIHENNYYLVFKKNYLIYYEIEEKYVKILKIINTKQEK